MKTRSDSRCGSRDAFQKEGGRRLGARSKQAYGSAMPDERAAASELLRHQQRASASSQAAQLEARAGLMADGAVDTPVPLARKNNENGLSEQLKSGIVSLSDLSVDHVQTRSAPLQRHASDTVVQRRLDAGNAIALLDYYDKNYAGILPRTTYFSEVHRNLVLNNDTLDGAKDALDAYMTEREGVEMRGEGRAPVDFAPLAAAGNAAVHEEHGSTDEAIDTYDPVEAESMLALLQSQKRPDMPGGPGRSASSAGIAKSTIRYAHGLEEAASSVGISSASLASRKPHTKRGTGSSGTNHDKADGDAALRARSLVEAKLREKQGGGFTSISDSLRQQEKSSLAGEARDEKQAAAVAKQIEVAQKDLEDYKDWIASLAPAIWRQKQDTLGNDVRQAPQPKKVKKLKLLAKSKGWPTEWEAEYASQLNK